MAGRTLIEKLFGRAAEVAEAAPETAAKAAARARRGVPVGPTILLATGAGVAFWYWTQWSRGRAESDAVGAAKPKPEDS